MDFDMELYDGHKITTPDGREVVHVDWRGSYGDGRVEVNPGEFFTIYWSRWGKTPCGCQLKMTPRKKTVWIGVLKTKTASGNYPATPAFESEEEARARFAGTLYQIQVEVEE